MKLLMVTNWLPPYVVGGYDLGCLDLALKMAARGHEVTLLSASVEPSLHNAAAPPEVEGLRLHRTLVANPCAGQVGSATEGKLPTAQFGEDSFQASHGALLTNCCVLRQTMEQVQPDVIWLFDISNLGPLGIYETALTSGCPVVHHLMDFVGQRVRVDALTEAARTRWCRAKRQISAIACSRKISEGNADHASFLQSHVVYNGRDLPPEPVRPEATPGEGLRMVYFGRVAAEKGILPLLDALERALAKSTPQVPCQLDIYGAATPGFQAELEARIADAGNLSGRVHLKGFTDRADLLNCLAQYDLAVLPLDDREPFAYAPLEAIAHGLPVLVPDRAVEIFQADATPISVSTRDDPQRLTAALAWALSHRVELASVWRRQYAIFRAHCDYDSVVLPQLEHILQQAPPPQVPLAWDTLICQLQQAHYYNTDSGADEADRHLRMHFVTSRRTVELANRLYPHKHLRNALLYLARMLQRKRP